MTVERKEFHQVANIFPLLEGEDFEKLKADVQANGLLESIWLHPDGRIIDGRNRYRACLEVGAEPVYRTWDGKGSLVEFVTSLNLHRRHLTSSQRAALAVEIERMLAEEARKRQLATLKQGDRSPDVERFPPRDGQGKARDRAAVIMGTNGRYVSDAKKLADEVPVVFEQVKRGKLNIPEAKKLSRLPEAAREPVLQRILAGQARTVKEAHRQVKDEEAAQRMASPSPPAVVADCKIIIGDARHMDLSQFERYGVIIADPPWPYDNPKDHDPRMGGYTYQPMTLDEIQAIPVAELAGDNCILFLWGTWPKLPQVIRMIGAWDFEYVTGFPWVKTTRDGRPVYGIGHWVAGCSEYVLIGRRGKVSPPSTDNYLGLVGPAFEHSRKPDDVHDLAETLPGPYLELFARRPRPGWTVFGDAIDALPGRPKIDS